MRQSYTILFNNGELPDSFRKPRYCELCYNDFNPKIYYGVFILCQAGRTNDMYATNNLTICCRKCYHNNKRIVRN